MHFTFTAINRETFPVVVDLFDESRDDWVGSPDESWLANIVDSNSAQAVIIYTETTPVGYLQYTLDGQEIDHLAIFIAKEFRGQGFGPEILQQFVVSKAGYSQFKAYIDETDFLSTSAFEKAGFTKTGPVNDEGVFAFIRKNED